MRIAYVAAGAAGMYCGSCLNDNALARALIDLGHEVSLIPTYTPLRTDEDDVSIDRVFYGAIGVYLEQNFALFRHTPWLVDRILGNRALLGWASGLGASTDARDLGAMTLSMLAGEEGHQRKELDRLVDWLGSELRPDLVHLSNSLLIGMSRRIRDELKLPVLCSLQGEDLFLNDLREPYRSRVAEALRARAADVDGFVASSSFYVDVMRETLGVARERIHPVPLGIRLEGFAPAAEPPAGPFVVGYLARICPEKGLHLLVEAFHHLWRGAGRNRVRLKIAGYLGPRDRPYFDGIMEQIRGWGLENAVEVVGEVDREQKLSFLRSLHVLSVPTVYREPKGRFVLEALACGVPVVQPDHGAFPELLEATGGGRLVEPGSSVALADAFEDLRQDAAARRRLGERGRSVVLRDYSAEAMAHRMLDVYGRYLPAGRTQ